VPIGGDRIAIPERTETACRAREADSDERSHLWAGAVAMYPGFTAYQERAGCRIPVMVLNLV
jgi:hypothetical protein